MRKGAELQQQWQQDLEDYKADLDNHEKEQLDLFLSGKLPAGWSDGLRPFTANGEKNGHTCCIW